MVENLKYTPDVDRRLTAEELRKPLNALNLPELSNEPLSVKTRLYAFQEQLNIDESEPLSPYDETILLLFRVVINRWLRDEVPDTSLPAAVDLTNPQAIEMPRAQQFNLVLGIITAMYIESKTRRNSQKQTAPVAQSTPTPEAPVVQQDFNEWKKKVPEQIPGLNEILESVNALKTLMSSISAEDPAVLAANYVTHYQEVDNLEQKINGIDKTQLIAAINFYGNRKNNVQSLQESYLADRQLGYLKLIVDDQLDTTLARSSGLKNQLVREGVNANIPEVRTIKQVEEAFRNQNLVHSLDDYWKSIQILEASLEKLLLDRPVIESRAIGNLDWAYIEELILPEGRALLKQLENEMFQVWTGEVENIHPQFRDLRKFIESTVISPSQDPQPDLVSLSRLRSGANTAAIGNSTFKYLPSGRTQQYVDYIQNEYLAPADELEKQLRQAEFSHWQWKTEQPRTTVAKLLAVLESFRTRYVVNGTPITDSAVLDLLRKAITDAQSYIASSPKENNNQPHSSEQSQVLTDKLLTPLRDLLQKLEQRLKEQPQVYDEKWFAHVLELIDATEGYVSDAQVIDPTEQKSFSNYKADIKQFGKNPELRRSMLERLEARVYLHDAWVTVFVAQFDVNEFKLGYASLTPKNFETLFHEIPQIRQLVPLAVGIFEMGLKGILPNVDAAGKSWNWKDGKNIIAAEATKLLGNAEAVMIASQIVEATGMPSYYENDFKFTAPMMWRDVQNTEGRRKYYGDPKRSGDLGSGFRAHGFSSTVGKYWNEPDAINPLRNNARVNPIFEVAKKRGVPTWDLISDFWEYAVRIDPKTTTALRQPKEIIKISNKPFDVEPVQTLARDNRYLAGETPDFQKYQNEAVAKGDSILTPQQIVALKALPWQDIVRYDTLHFVQKVGSEELPIINKEAYKSFLAQSKERKKFHDFLTSEDFGANEFLSKNWLAKNKTVFDYLVNSAQVVRDLQGEAYYRALRGVQCLFLLAILLEHTPVTQAADELRWKPATILEVILAAQQLGFIDGHQADFLETQSGVKGLISPASRVLITEKALERAGLPGK